MALIRQFVRAWEGSTAPSLVRQGHQMYRGRSQGSGSGPLRPRLPEPTRRFSDACQGKDDCRDLYFPWYICYILDIYFAYIGNILGISLVFFVVVISFVNLVHIQAYICHIFGIKLAYFVHIISRSLPYLKHILACLGHILAITLAYLWHILCLFSAYPAHVLGISLACPQSIPSISLACQQQIHSISLSFPLVSAFLMYNGSEGFFF